MILISDVHGCYYTLRRLLRQCPDEEVVFCGDPIDRGPHSNLVVEFAMKQKIPTVMGNHEDLMLGHFGLNDRYDDGVWLMNGGFAALKSWGMGVPAEVIDWVVNLPFFLKFDDGLLVSHTGHGLGHEICKMSALWCREPNFPSDGLFRVFGHTPEKQPIITDAYAMIDTGAAYGRNGLGTLTALQWPSMRVFSQKYDESELAY